jgi:uncharacterized membrane protein YoaK (UPF0700 family)
MKAILVDAWRLIVPPQGDRHGPLSPLLLGLTVLTGLVDAFSYLLLGHVFVANMTGNVVFLGFAVAGSQGFSIPASIMALATFSLGALCGGRLIAARGVHRGRLLALATTGEAVLIGGATLVSLLTTRPGTGAVRYVLIALLGAGMGLQNSIARKIAVPDLTTTVLTLTITGVVADSRPAGGQGSRIGRRGLATIAMFLGALVGGLLVVAGHGDIALVVALAVVIVVASAATVASRPDASWARAAS